MYSPAVIDREQAALQARLLGVESAGLCDDVENSIGDILCDGLDELEAVLGNEPTVALDGDQIRQSVDKVMYQFQKHSVDNCRVFKRYSLQHIFNIQPQVAERMSRPPAAQSAPVETSGASEAESALDAELEQLRQQAHAANSKLVGMQIAESALSQQLAQCSTRLEWLSSLSSHAAPLQESMESIAARVQEVRAAVATIQHSMAEMQVAPEGATGVAAAKGGGGLPAEMEQLEADKAAFGASRDELQRLGAAAAASSVVSQ